MNNFIGFLGKCNVNHLLSQLSGKKQRLIYLSSIYVYLTGFIEKQTYIFQNEFAFGQIICKYNDPLVSLFILKMNSEKIKLYFDTDAIYDFTFIIIDFLCLKKFININVFYII